MRAFQSEADYIGLCTLIDRLCMSFLANLCAVMMAQSCYDPEAAVGL